MSDYRERNITCKLVLLGEAAVGKSSIVIRFVSDSFDDNKEPTIGAAFLTKRCEVNEKVYKLEIWDTAGQERFHSLAPMYYRNASAAIVVYDITKAGSFERAISWVLELQNDANNDIIICLVGNKLDLVHDDSKGETSSLWRQVSVDKGRNYSERNKLLFFEASAKTGENISNIFYTIAKNLNIDNVQTSNRLNDSILQMNQVALTNKKNRACGC